MTQKYQPLIKKDNLHCNLEFKLRCEEQYGISFLDILIIRKKEILENDVFRKPVVLIL